MKNKLKLFSMILLCGAISFLAVGATKEQQDLFVEKRLSQYLATLIEFPTISQDVHSNAEALEWVRQQLERCNLHCRIHQSGGKNSLVITTRDTKKPKIWLVGHIDVVPAEPALFKAHIDAEKMYGRGAYDMKMAIACYLLLAEELKDRMQNYDFGIMLTSDEEVGGHHGVKALLEQGYSSQVAFLPDGGFDWNVEESAKGILQLKIRSYGTTAHSSRPDRGVNAINHLMGALDALGKQFDNRVQIASHPTLSIGLIKGGKAVNQVPDYAEAELDIRYPYTIRAQELMRLVHDAVAAYPQVHVEKILEAEPNHVDTRCQEIVAFMQLAKKMYGIDVGVTGSYGASDARFFSARQIPVLVISPKGGELHGDHEWVDLHDLARFYQTMKAWVMQIAQAPLNDPLPG